MNWLSRAWAELGALRGRTGRDLQLRLDTARLYVLTEPGFAKSLPPGKESVALENLPPFEEQHASVSRRLAGDAVGLIVCAGQAAERASAGQSSAARHDAEHRAASANAGGLADSTASIFSAMQVPAGRHRRGREAAQFSVHVRESSIDGAGLGVFVDGKVEAGSLITLYPGITYKPSEVIHMADYPNVSKNNEYLMWRYDGIIVDGGDTSVSSVIAASGPDAPPREKFAHCAVGQIVNHAPKGGSPNALQYAVTLDARLLAPRMRCFLPNVPFDVVRDLNVPGTENEVSGERPDWRKAECVKDSATMSWRSAEGKLFTRSGRNGFISRSLAALEDMVIRQRVAGASAGTSSGALPSHTVIESLAIVAARQIENEEVFINYRFNPASPDLPEWYEDCNPSESKRRWLQDGFWGTTD